MSFAAFFPGQGSQIPGMGQSIYENSAAARVVFDATSEISGKSVTELCFHSEASRLSQTINTQIAIFTCSLATFAALREQGVTASACAGFSLGEYSAMTAAGILTLEDGLRLVRRRGELMQEASERTDGCMTAIVGLPDETIERICAQTEELVLPATYNYDGQLVIAGARAGVEAAVAACMKAGARRAIPLAVSGGFHTPLMADAAAKLRRFAEGMTFHAPELPVYTGVTGGPLDIADYSAHLEQHMVSPVRWKQLVARMQADGYSSALEIGAGKTLTGFSRRHPGPFSCRQIETMEQVLSAANEWRGENP